MTFRPDAQLDPSQVEDRRGFGGGGRRGGAIALGGGGIGTVVLVLILGLLGVDITGSTGGGAGGGGGFGGLNGREVSGEPPGQALTACRTGEDANRRDDCRIVGYVNSIQTFWNGAFRSVGERYQPARTVFFTDSVQTACGGATSAVGPFYCPGDKRIYIDLGFYEELRSKFGAQGGPLSQAYVIAHEYGHHVQNLTGVLERAGRGESGPQSNAVRVELQADCYAGVWAGNAVRTGYLLEITAAQIRDALSAAAAVGDDRIQSKVSGRVDPENWTHGSAEQRQRWFTVGYRTGDPTACDTFRGQV